MNFLITIILLIITAIVLGGVSIFVMNISSSIVYQFIKSEIKISTKYIIALIILTLIHSYIFLSFLSTLILLCYACTTKVMGFKIILLGIAFIISVILAFSGYIQAKNKLNDLDVGRQEPFHVNALGLNALISSIGFIVLSIFPKLISFGWPWVEKIVHNFV
ncbi:hypothetical protein [Pedobacter mendelii]|uniref:Integral membrane protein n=1 Tax=Pedobacter mendelii TaxID=1908240 RepID=A0ABQ2BF43_9SPHI|nr:hypothetical protein [Pedobacter mendelii]GGI24741.1 hypothetical protein GCM10008119_14170 [Pedobacter mendelii]